jgi:hypothetical protein
MKCQYCNNQTKAYQIDTRNNQNRYFPVCRYHKISRGETVVTYDVPDHIPPFQGLRYLAKLQRNAWINLC